MGRPIRASPNPSESDAYEFRWRRVRAHSRYCRANASLSWKLPCALLISNITSSCSVGTSDRTMSMVGLGEYAPSHDDYDIHAMAPSPLPADAMWWIEIEKPDGTKVTGSAKPIM